MAENAHEYDFFIVPAVPEIHAPQMSQYSEKKRKIESKISDLQI